MREFIHNHGVEVCKGAFGVSSTLLGVLTSLQEHVEHTMRCISLGVGIMVGVLTCISIIRGWKKKP
jgi:hypothetical protein